MGKGVRKIFNSIQTPYVFVLLTIRKTFLDFFRLIRKVLATLMGSVESSIFAIFAPSNSYFTEKKSLGAPGGRCHKRQSLEFSWLFTSWNRKTRNVQGFLHVFQTGIVGIESNQNQLRLWKRQSLSTPVLFRTTFTQTIMLKLLIRDLLWVNAKTIVKAGRCNFFICEISGEMFYPYLQRFVWRRHVGALSTGRKPTDLNQKTVMH